MKNYILKIYLHPKGKVKGFTIFENLDWKTECEAEKSLDYSSGCSSMSQHSTRSDAIEHAKKQLPRELFNKCL